MCTGGQHCLGKCLFPDHTEYAQSVSLRRIRQRDFLQDLKGEDEDYTQLGGQEKQVVANNLFTVHQIGKASLKQLVA